MSKHKTRNKLGGKHSMLMKLSQFMSNSKEIISSKNYTKTATWKKFLVCRELSTTSIGK